MKYAILLSIIFVFLVTFSENATAAARIRALEISVCHTYYRGNRIPEHLCKIAPVQEQLASLRAWLGVLEAIPTLIIGLPLGHYADNVGRRPVLLLNVTGLWMNLSSIAILCYFNNFFPPGSVLISPLFLLLGGGKYVYQAIITSIVVDCSHEKKTVSIIQWLQFANTYWLGIHCRTRNLFLVFSLCIITNLIGPPIGAVLLSRTAFGALFLGIGIILLAYPAVLCLPQTRSYGRSQFSDTESTALSRGYNQRIDDSNPPETHPSQFTMSNGSVLCSYTLKFCNTARKPFTDFTALLSNKGLRLAFLSILIGTGGAFTDILLPYISITLRWPLAKASFILPILSALQLFYYSFALPSLSRVLQKRGSWGPEQSDWILAFTSGIPLFLGTMVIGLSPSIESLVIGLIIQTAGCGSRLYLLSFVSVMVGKKDHARLFTSISLVDTVGQLIRAPFMESLFATSLHLTGLARGLPFFISSACQLAASIALWSLNPKSTEPDEDED